MEELQKTATLLTQINCIKELNGRIIEYLMILMTKNWRKFACLKYLIDFVGVW